jgi:phage shock protein PspC (stress-responsive transcriptional regulator)
MTEKPAENEPVEPPPPPPPSPPSPPPTDGFPPPGGYPPPGPPPSGSFFPPPRPTGGAFATKYGLIRPQQGRWLAGVAAAIGRATNTDPVLWRVLFAVLTLFGGVGLLVYLLGWLLIPSEGDTASAGEALIGRGQSSTSTPVAIGLGILAAIMFAVSFSSNVRTALIGLAVIIGAALLVSRGGGSLGRPADTTPEPPPSTFMPPPTPYTSFAAPPTGPYPPGQNPVPPGEPTATEQDATDTPTGYRPPFAPHGPYASSSPYAQSLGYPPVSPQYPGLVQAPPPTKPPRERSRLGRVVLSLICLALGTLVIVDVAGASVPGAAYVATALAVVGFGLVVGAWLGRARWLIIPGLVLTVALIGTYGSDHWDGGRDFAHGPRGNVTWTPTNVSELAGDYRVDVGNGTLDLSKVDFTDRTVPVNAHVNLGNLVVILPPSVDADVSAKVDGGSADVLGQRWDGLGNSERQVHDNGADGVGGGKLELTASVDLGKLEVRR